jgi:hypothetical protein
MEKEFYTGFNGKRRLKAINKKTAEIEAQLDDKYEGKPESIHLNDEVTWEGMARLVYAMGRLKVASTWQGSRDYGYIRLCSQWIKGRGLTSVGDEDALEMAAVILPHKLYEEVRDESKFIVQ